MITPDLARLFDPQSIVFIGASDRAGSIGQRALENLVEHSAFTGSLYLVNPKRDRLYERPCFASVSDLPQVPDLAIICTPADTVLQALRGCAEVGVRFAIVFTAGFGEVSEDGKAIEAAMKALVRSSGMRIYGPNTPGLTNVTKRLGFAFSPAFRTDLRGGPVGLATQGGALGRTLMQSMDRGLGIGVWCSGGNEVDLEISDFIQFMARDSTIKVIAAIIEGVRDGGRFIEAAQAAILQGKPLALLKIGKTTSGMAAAQSHTAAMSGVAAVNSAVFRQLNIIEVNDLDELTDVVSLFAQTEPEGDERIAIYSLSGGAAALAADMSELHDLPLASLTDDTCRVLREVLPAFASINNPLDISGNVLSTPEILHPSLTAVVSDPRVGVTILPIPLDYGAFIETVCEVIVRVREETGAMIVPVWMSDRTGGGYGKLVAGGLVPIRSLRNAALAVARWRDFGRTRKDLDPQWRPFAQSPLRATSATRTLSELEGKRLLAEHGIPILRGRLCVDPSQIAAAITEIDSPVVAKIVSPDITHKSDIGAVRLGIRTVEEAREAYEAITTAVRLGRPDADIHGVLFEQMAPPGGIEVFVGVHPDPVFGHLMTFGLGGIFVELFKDVSRRLLPLTCSSAAALIRETRCFGLLSGARGRPAADLAALEQLLLRISEFVERHVERLTTLEINPIWVGPAGTGVFALDSVITFTR
jgi:acyl-CoA synthetase (NDP forming)